MTLQRVKVGGLRVKTYSIRVVGRVQGVGFRYYTLTKARDMGVNGWVKNLPDGTVEICVAGEEQVMDDFIDYIRKGPSYSDVSDIIVNEVESNSLNFHSNEFMIR